MAADSTDGRISVPVNNGRLIATDARPPMIVAVAVGQIDRRLAPASSPTSFFLCFVSPFSSNLQVGALTWFRTRTRTRGPEQAHRRENSGLPLPPPCLLDRMKPEGKAVWLVGSRPDMADMEGADAETAVHRQADCPSSQQNGEPSRELWGKRTWVPADGGI